MEQKQNSKVNPITLNCDLDLNPLDRMTVLKCDLDLAELSCELYTILLR